MKISNHFQESSQKLSSHKKNQEHYTDITSSRPTKPQLEWINLMHGDQSPKILNFQQKRKQSKPCEVYKQSYNAKPKSASVCQPKITIGLTKEKTSGFKTKKPGEFLLNWRPLPSDWAATTSKPKEVQDYIPEDNMKRISDKRMKNQEKTDKTEHGMEKRENTKSNRSQSQQKSKSTQDKVKVKVNPEKSTVKAEAIIEE
ncbi:hypothetical protein Tco_1443361 [Tanacetum coccineum]